MYQRIKSEAPPVQYRTRVGSYRESVESADFDTRGRAVGRRVGNVTVPQLAPPGSAAGRESAPPCRQRAHLAYGGGHPLVSPPTEKPPLGSVRPKPHTVSSPETDGWRFGAMAECSSELREWAAATGCQALLPALAALGVETPADIVLLEEADTAPMMAEIRRVQQVKFERAVEALRSEVGVAVPVPAGDALIVPDYKPPQVDSASEFTEFTELEHQEQRVLLLGLSVPMRTTLGAACAFLLLVIVVLATVGFNSANDSCVAVECGAYGTCEDGRCACQPGYTGGQEIDPSTRSLPARSVSHCLTVSPSVPSSTHYMCDVRSTGSLN